VGVASLVLVGVAAGAVLSLWASRCVATLLYGLEPRDPTTFIGAAMLLGTIGLLAGWLPARRAARVRSDDRPAGTVISDSYRSVAR
jgi:ABC-type antimicrobial peptide transport system permease subunit